MLVKLGDQGFLEIYTLIVVTIKCSELVVTIKSALNIERPNVLSGGTKHCLLKIGSKKLMSHKV